MKKSYLVILLKIVITAVLFLLIFRIIEPNRVFTALARIRPGYFLGALLLLAPNLFFHFLCWRYVLIIAGIKVPKKLIFESLLVGYTFAVVTPGGMGEIGRGIYFKGLSRFQMVGLSFIDKFYSMLMTLLIGLTGVVFYFRDIRAWLAGALMFLVLALAFSPRVLVKALYRVVPLLPFLQEEVRVFLDNLKGFYPRKTLKLLLLSSLFHAAFFTQFFLLLRAFHADIAILPVFMIMAIVFMVKALLPITVADLGMREGLAVYFFTQAPYLLKPEMAFNAAFLLFTINILLASIAGLFFIPRIQWVRPGRGRKEDQS